MIFFLWFYKLIKEIVLLQGKLWFLLFLPECELCCKLILQFFLLDLSIFFRIQNNNLIVSISKETSNISSNVNYKNYIVLSLGVFPFLSNRNRNRKYFLRSLALITDQNPTYHLTSSLFRVSSLIGLQWKNLLQVAFFNFRKFI